MTKKWPEGLAVRDLALRALAEAEAVHMHVLMSAVLAKYDYLPVEDKALLKRLVSGVTEKRLIIDGILNKISKQPVEKLEPMLAQALRLGAYQILYMDAIPDYAAADSSVELVKRHIGRRAVGYANAVLRNLARQREALMAEDHGSGLPPWLLSLWERAYGREIVGRMEAALASPPPLYWRLRRDMPQNSVQEWEHRIREAGFSLEPYLGLERHYVSLEKGDVAKMPGFAQGWLAVQNPMSALAVEALGLAPGQRLADACAAPGGKSLLAAELGAEVLAMDKSRSKLDAIGRAQARMEAAMPLAGSLRCLLRDGREAAPELEGWADALLLDMPCSGLGVIQRKRDIPHKLQPEQLAQLCSLQKEIFRATWPMLRPGGVLVYSTCTLHPGENEEMADWIEAEFPFAPASLEAFMPEQLWQAKLDLEARGICAGANRFLALPGYMEGDGFFIARFVRRA